MMWCRENNDLTRMSSTANEHGFDRGGKKRSVDRKDGKKALSLP